MRCNERQQKVRHGTFFGTFFELHGKRIIRTSRVCSLELKDFNQAIEQYCKQGTKEGTQPVDPVIVGEAVQDHARPKRPGRVQRAYDCAVSFKRHNDVIICRAYLQ